MTIEERKKLKGIREAVITFRESVCDHICGRDNSECAGDCEIDRFAFDKAVGDLEALVK